MNELPQLDENDYVILFDIYNDHRQQFFTNATPFFVSEMRKYILLNQVWRVSIMGETRGGKSEGAQTISFSYITVFNEELAKNKDFLDRIQSRFAGEIKIEKLKFNVEHIRESQSDYLYEIRAKASTKDLSFGQIWIIDENKDNGGLGSYTEKLEQTNMNNIIAKFCQSEIWITPRKMIEANAPYGIKMYKKDYQNKCNWGLLYKIDMTPTGTEFNFLGWIKLPLHPYEDHRREYELKKNQWIGKELEGGADDRMVLRHKVSKDLSEDKLFSQLNKKETNFLRNTKEQKGILEEWIIERKVQNFNEMEKEQIVSMARDFAKRKWEEDD